MAAVTFIASSQCLTTAAAQAWRMDAVGYLLLVQCVAVGLWVAAVWLFEPALGPGADDDGANEGGGSGVGVEDPKEERAVERLGERLGGEEGARARAVTGGGDQEAV